MNNDSLHVLLIDDDEDDYVITRDLLGQVFPENVVVDWEPSFESGRKAIERDDHDVCLVDYRLGRHSGLELLKHAGEHHVHAPVIMLTGVSDRDVDAGALAAGAADYLVKGQFGSTALERSIRYAVERKRHQEELERSNEALRATERALRVRIERESLVNTIGQTLRSSLDPMEIKSTAATKLGEALDIDRCYWVRFDVALGTAHIENEWCRNDVPALGGEYLLPPRRFLDLAAEHLDETTVVIDDVDAVGRSPSILAINRDPRVKSVIRVPLFTDGRLEDLLCVETVDSPRAWEPEEVALVETVCTLARSAAAMADAHQRELRIATILQGGLLPREDYNVPGLDIGIYYKPAMSEANVGGDFCDILAIDDNRFALVVGDISGKGLPAASQVATIRDMLRCALYWESDLVEVVNKLNAILSRHNVVNGFATLFVGVFDTRVRNLAYISCNLEPMFVLHRDAGTIEEIGPSGPPVSISDIFAYDVAAVTLSEGDVVLLFTDGLSEAGPDRTHMLLTEGTKEMLAAHCRPGIEAKRLVEEIAEHATQYANGILRDDICLLAAIVKP